MKEINLTKLIHRFRNILHKFIPIPLLLALVLLPFSCRALYYNFPDITDHIHFPSRTIENSPDSIFYFTKADKESKLGNEIFASNHFMSPNVVNLDTYLEDTKSAAFVIIRNDSILYEKYNKEFSENTSFNIFSITKVFMTTLVGIAIDEGSIESIDQPMTEYLPEFSAKEGFDKITIRHLLLHTSGIKSSDSKYNSVSENAKYYYGRNLRKLVFEAELYEEPGTSTHYESVNTQLLGLVLEKATNTTLSEYLQEKIWQKIGMQYNATWNTDYERGNPIEKCFASLNCTAIDLAKLGRLYTNNGMWNNQRILSQQYIKDATSRDVTGGSSLNFQYNFRPGPMPNECYYALGLYGQLIVIYPVENLIIVRIGEADLNYNPPFIKQSMIQIIEQLAVAK
ncbi:serine hydrolase domain-containing protein [Bacteroidota bacterium]